MEGSSATFRQMQPGSKWLQQAAGCLMIGALLLSSGGCTAGRPSECDQATKRQQIASDTLIEAEARTRKDLLVVERLAALANLERAKNELLEATTVMNRACGRTK